jgi:hypothetical protein
MVDSQLVGVGGEVASGLSGFPVVPEPWVAEKDTRLGARRDGDRAVGLSDVGQERTDLRGMSVEALHGGVGKVEEVIQERGASFLVVDTGPWILGKKVLLPAGLVSGIDVDDELVKVERYKDEIRARPSLTRNGTESPPTATRSRVTTAPRSRRRDPVVDRSP